MKMRVMRQCGDAAMLRITVYNPTALAHIYIYPCGRGRLWPGSSHVPVKESGQSESPEKCLFG